MSKGLGSVQRQMLALILQRANYSWSTSSFEIMNALFPDDVTKKRLKWDRMRYYGGVFDGDGGRQDIEVQHCDFTETRKAQVRQALRGLETPEKI